MVDIISIHVPKTAGSVFREKLTQIYGRDHTLWDYTGYGEADLTVIGPQTRAIVGHFGVDKYYRHFPSAKLIIWLRNPIFRLLSHYFYWLYVAPNYNEAKGQNFQDFIEREELQNIFYKHAGGVKLNEFYFVGIQEFFQEDLVEVSQMLGWSDSKEFLENVNTYPEYKTAVQELLADRRLMNRIAELNWADFELYQEALNLRAKRRGESRLIQQTLAEWERSQFELSLKEVELQQVKAQLLATQKKLECLQNRSELRVDDSLGAGNDLPDSLIKNAWLMYEAGNLQEMAEWLRKSLNHSHLLKTEIVVFWVESFAKFSATKGREFNIYSLTNSSAWQELVNSLLT
ncbi:MAG: hypothetical protein ACM37W_23780 [Actinomycetota bacterium]